MNTFSICSYWNNKVNLQKIRDVIYKGDVSHSCFVLLFVFNGTLTCFSALFGP